jgi:4-hydroxybenzoate polyprenyltransferase
LARLDRPIGTWLLLLPCWWGLALAPEGWHRVDLYALFAAGATVMRAAGCVINDLWDRDIDRRVARTAGRPLASGAVGVPAALAYLMGLLLLGLLVLIQLDPVAVATGFAVMAIVVLYPLAKRVTHWPQLVLGFAFNWGILVAWTAVTGGLAAPAFWLYASGIAWTLGYDTIYAHQDKADDAAVGVKSTAILFGTRTKPWLAAFYAATVAMIAAAGWQVGLAWPFYVGLGLAAAHLAWQVATVDLDRPKDCLAKFKSNRDFGLAVVAALILGQIARP